MLRETAGLNRLREVGCSTEKRQQLGCLQPDNYGNVLQLMLEGLISIFTTIKIPAQIYVHEINIIN